MKTSARNELSGTVTEVKSGGVMSEIVVKVSPSVSICATITNDARDSLGLEIGSGVSALIKSSFVVLSKEKLKATARNNIEAKVSEVITGAINSEVKLSVGEKKLCAIVTNDAIKDLDIKTNDTVYAIFKASSVILVA
ncbi:molybdenum-pterin-binding protein [Sulfurimonas crateris]|uniref:Molybdenum-pterin-binding protein n=1 Tax=Sulfurimonas crateris TaxID=2574727 RepID=A0A4U2Z775_9BACT|nr:TOBE domain-containing protein [Sulfurimonas crateris]TKI69330.1 molybdenum-pterin-binding protein [Sulfurimonas crateris]